MPCLHEGHSCALSNAPLLIPQLYHSQLHPFPLHCTRADQSNCLSKSITEEIPTTFALSLVIAHLFSLSPDSSLLSQAALSLPPSLYLCPQSGNVLLQGFQQPLSTQRSPGGGLHVPKPPSRTLVHHLCALELLPLNLSTEQMQPNSDCINIASNATQKPLKVLFDWCYYTNMSPNGCTYVELIRNTHW